MAHLLSIQLQWLSLVWKTGLRTIKNKLPLSVELQNPLDSNGSHEQLQYELVVHEVNGSLREEVIGY